MLNEFRLIFFSSNSLATARKTSLPRVRSVIVVAIRRGGTTEAIKLSFSEGDSSADLNSLRTKNEIRGVLEEKYFDQIHSVLAFLAAFVSMSGVNEIAIPWYASGPAFSSLHRFLTMSRSERAGPLVF